MGQLRAIAASAPSYPPATPRASQTGNCESRGPREGAPAAHSCYTWSGDTISRCLHSASVARTVDTRAEQASPKVPGGMPRGTGSIQIAVPAWN
jgi:hypothetical protein